MESSSKTILDVISIGTGVAGASISATIGDVLGIVLTCINIVYLLIIIGLKVYAKIRDALKDGKIDDEEIKDIEETIKDGMNEVNKHGKKDR